VILVKLAGRLHNIRPPFDMHIAPSPVFVCALFCMLLWRSRSLFW
jgi:hypothetical protein